MSTLQALAIESALAVIQSLRQPHLLADRHGRLHGCNQPALELFGIGAAPDDIRQICANPEQLLRGIRSALRSSGRYPAAVVAPDRENLRASITPLRQAPGEATDIALIAIQPRSEANRSLIQLKAEVAAAKKRQARLRRENRTLRHKVESVIPTLKRMAFLDSLTGVGNKRFFEERFAKEWRRATRGQHNLALLIVDIDRFKRYNDELGHAAGDRCLADVARAMSLACRRSDDVVCRVGGEEFAILAPHTDLEGAMALAEAVRRAVADLAIPHPGSEHRIVTLSIGVGSVQPAHGDDRAQLYSRIDSALYRAKADGRNRACALATDDWRPVATLPSAG